MRRLAWRMLLLLMAPCTAWGHPMPNSAVVLRIHRTEIGAELTLPIGELAMGWEKPLPRTPKGRCGSTGRNSGITSAPTSARPLPMAALDRCRAGGDPGRRSRDPDVRVVDDDPARRRALWTG